MANFPFQVEVVDPQGRFVLVRELERNRFRLMPGAKLHGCAVTAVSQPQVKGADGEPRLDLFLFRLERPEDARRFEIGQAVTLNAEPASQLIEL